MSSLRFAKLAKYVKDGKISSKHLKDVMAILKSQLRTVISGRHGLAGKAKDRDPITGEKVRVGFASARDMENVAEPPSR